jgi:hypothetical protein
VRRNTGHPAWRRFGAPPLLDHLGDSVDQFVAKTVGVFVFGNHPSPPGITPAGRDTTGRGTQLRGQSALEAEFGERPRRRLLLGLEWQVSVS